VECQNNLAIHSERRENGALEDKRVSIDGAFERRETLSKNKTRLKLERESCPYIFRSKNTG